MSTGQVSPFGELVKRHRLAVGLSQEELAERAGLSPRGISDLERGARTQPRPGTVRLLADALNLSDADRTTFFATAHGKETAVPDARAAISPVPTAAPHAPAPAPPTGTVTFLFTDIEGSTRLLQRLGPRYAEVLVEHRRLVREAFAAHSGYEVDTQGDSFFVAFPTAQDALMTAVEATRALAVHSWPEDVGVRLRMGLHSGAPQLIGDRYVGLDVHRAARIAAAGHGGQILLSEAAAGLVRADLPEDVTLRDLGAHRLKDLQQPERIYQLVLSGLPADFPALKSLEARPHNLPVQLTPLIGREREVAQIVALLGRDEVRLVTITGPGGVGKTRLSVQVAAELLDAFPDGVWNVRLSRLSDPALVTPTIATTLGLKETGALPLADVLRNYLRDRRLLLVLDNFEHVAAAAVSVAELLEQGSGVKALVTSRAPLRLQGEHEYSLHPLALPDSAHLPLPDHLSRYAALALFVERAQAAEADFAVTYANAPAVAAICERLDGLPLAIELAAARVKVLPPPALLKRLERSLPVLTGGARDVDERQQTMRNTLAWSYNLLQPEEQRLFRRLSVFVGGCTLDAAEVACVAPEGAEPLGLSLLDGLQALLEQNLIQQREEGGEPRFGMLHVIREFALEHLEASGEAETLRRAHADYFVALAERVEPEWRRRDQLLWLVRIERELDNTRAVLEWASHVHRLQFGFRLAGALGRFWFLSGRIREGRDWLERLLAADDSMPEPTPSWTDACSATPVEQVSRAVGAKALWAAGELAVLQCDFARAQVMLDQSLLATRAEGDAALAAIVLNRVAFVAFYQGEWESAVERFEESLALARELGDPILIGPPLCNLGWVAVHQGNPELAVARIEEALTYDREMGDLYGLTMSLAGLAAAARLAGNFTRALSLMQEVLQLVRQSGDPRQIAEKLEYTANVYGAAGQGSKAARLLGAAAATRETDGTPQPPIEGTATNRAVATSRTALGEDAWAAAYAAGQALSLEEAIAEALGEEKAPQAVGVPTEPGSATP